MKNTPIERHLIDETINEFQIVDFSKATIREVKAIASKQKQYQALNLSRWKWVFRDFRLCRRSKSGNRSAAKRNCQPVSRY